MKCTFSKGVVTRGNLFRKFLSVQNLFSLLFLAAPCEMKYCKLNLNAPKSDALTCPLLNYRGYITDELTLNKFH